MPLDLEIWISNGVLWPGICALSRIRAAKLKIQAERRIGESLGVLKLKGGNRKSKSHDGTLILRLKDLGINRNQSSRWQQEASLSDEEFEAYCREIETGGEEISSSALLRFVRSAHRGQQPTHPRQKLRSRNLGELQRHAPLTESPGVDQAFDEIRGHLQSLQRIFATTCSLRCTHLKTIELRQVPRYLREVSARLDEIQEHVEVNH